MCVCVCIVFHTYNMTHLYHASLSIRVSTHKNTRTQLHSACLNERARGCARDRQGVYIACAKCASAIYFTRIQVYEHISTHVLQHIRTCIRPCKHTRFWGARSAVSQRTLNVFDTHFAIRHRATCACSSRDCACACTRVIHAYMHTCTCIQTYLQPACNKCTYLWYFLYVFMYVCMCVFLRMCVCMFVCIYVRMYVCTYVCMYECI